ncbi:hypothetical protein L1987_32701 [Smallanthus sonchifolius]|uniref:Uncharacterized protein n=1 Tax=Smallanthus sonchifolius TaxID=185202 RepID=A0ACB9HNS2_9ASTR|nr:hypothetical protein L1987_32701 [Smallanthus sonchifolius]
MTTMAVSCQDLKGYDGDDMADPGYGGADEAKMLQRQINGTFVKIGMGANRAATTASFLHIHGFVYPFDIACFEQRVKPKNLAKNSMGQSKG